MISLGEGGRSKDLAEEIFKGDFLVLYHRKDNSLGPVGARLPEASKDGLVLDHIDGKRRLPFFVDNDGVQSYIQNEYRGGPRGTPKAWKFSGLELAPLILSTPAASLFVASDFYMNKKEESYHLSDADREELGRIIQEKA